MIKILKEKINYFFENISLQKNQQKLKRLNIYLSILCFIFIFNSYSQINEQINVNLKFTFLEVFLTILSYFFIAILWSKYMKLIYKGSFKDYFYNWSISKLGKFVPSGIMVFTIRLNQKIKNNRSSKEIFIGTLEEQFLFPLISIPAIIICLRLEFVISKLISLTFFLIFSFIIVKFVYSKFRKNKNSILNFPFLFLSNLYLQFYVIYLVANRFGYDQPIEVSLYYFLASSIGLFFVGVPSGLGIREFIFLISVGTKFSIENLFGFILTIRILFFIADISYGIFGIISKILKDKNDLN